MPRGGARPGAGRPKGSKNRFNAETKRVLDTFIQRTLPDVLFLWKKAMRDNPSAALGAWLGALKHVTTPARAALPGEDENKPMVIEVRTRTAGDSNAQSDAVAQHQSEAASAAAALRAHTYTGSDEGDPE